MKRAAIALLAALLMVGCVNPPVGGIESTFVYVIPHQTTGQIQRFVPGQVPAQLGNAGVGSFAGPSIIFYPSTTGDILGRRQLTKLFVADGANVRVYHNVNLTNLTPALGATVPAGGTVDYLQLGSQPALAAIVGSTRQVHEIDAHSDSIVRTYTLPVGATPIRAEVSNTEMFVLVTGSEPALYAFQRSDGSQIGKVTLPAGVSDMTVQLAGGEVYVSNLARNEVYEIETAGYSIRLTKEIPSPTALLMTTGNLFVASTAGMGNGRLYKLSLADELLVIGAQEVGASPFHISFDVDKQHLYVSNWASNFLSRVNTAMTESVPIPVGFTPGATAVTSDFPY